MSMDPPKVLLEAGFLEAVAHPADPRHHEARALYEHLVRGYRHQELLLVAVSDHLRDVEVSVAPTTAERVRYFVHRSRTGLFAPVDALYVGWQHRRAVSRTTVDDARVALTLVIADRYRIRRIATLDPAYDAHEIERVHLPAAEAHEAVPGAAAGDPEVSAG